ncbi:26S proteasome non-ATPase regulatory subunit 4-like [Ptychodera flava]|uniref:26S proteasome non-ATPase regulatory subunit 4-like n=1 Tax=Ptychodera flava TaxID=63121 RepID=UPI00396A5D9B
MVLESTMVCVDTSEYMRNGDFIPTRLQAQQDAVNLVCHSKTRSNPENNVGLLTLSEVKVLTTLTTDVGKILASLHQVQPKGSIKFSTAIRVAHLALKHRQGRNHRMRIVVFVGSPVEEEEKELTKVAKKLKKEKVNIDIVNFGEDAANTSKLESFVNTINGKDGSGSHLVTVPPGPILSDALVSSPVIVGEDGSGAVPGLSGTSNEFEFGFDPSTDPELAMALRISMEEQRQRQDDESRKAQEESVGVTEGGGEQRATVAADSEEALLEQAIAMSMQQPPSSVSESVQDTPMPDFSAMTEEEQIAYAMRMSLTPQVSSDISELANPQSKEEEMPMDTTEAADDKQPDPDDDYSEVMSDPAFLQSVLENLPGVDPSSEAIKNAMGTLTQQPKSDDKDKKKKDDKDKK